MMTKLKLLFLFTLLCLSPASADFSDQQAADLKSTGIPIVVASWLPDGFSLVAVETEARGGPGGTNYRIVYTDPEGTGFSVEATNGGIGGVAGDRQIPVKCFLGESEIIVFDQDGTSSAFGAWMGDGPFYRVGGKSRDDKYIKTEVSPEMMARLTTMLVPMK